MLLLPAWAGRDSRPEAASSAQAPQDLKRTPKRLHAIVKDLFFRLDEASGGRQAATCSARKASASSACWSAEHEHPLARFSERKFSPAHCRFDEFDE